MQRGKNYKNRLRLAEVIVKNKMSRFLWFTVHVKLSLATGGRFTFYVLAGSDSLQISL